MSAALWSEPRPTDKADEAHPGLGRTTIRPQQLAGRAMAAAAAVPPRRRMRLEVWGETEQDADHAQRKVREHPSYHGWEIVSIGRGIGPVSTISDGNRFAVAHDAYYGWAWAVYETTD